MDPDNVQVDVVQEPATTSFGVRSAAQAGVSISGLFGLLKAFGIWEPTADQVLYLTPFLMFGGTIAWRFVENKLGKGLLRNVQ